MADVAKTENEIEKVTDKEKQIQEEDEKYLYGKSESKNDDNEINGVEEIKKTGEEDEEDGEFEESDDDDDDDNIQVHIGEVNTSANAQYGTPVSWKKDASGTVKAASLPTQGQKKIDVNTVGLINGQPIYEYDLDTEQDEKPWRKPGADISDYFNYGFTEDTWKQYCEKQRRMRLESNRGPYSVAPSAVANAASTAQVEIEVLPDGRTRVKAGPPPDRKVEGSIHVLGSDADARRKQKEEELLALALGSSRVVPQQPFGAPRPMFTTLPSGAMMYNPMGQPIPNSSGDSAASAGGIPSSANSSQGQQIQSIGPNMVTSGFPPGGLQYIPGTGIPGLHGVPGGPQMFPPPNNMGMDFPHNDGFVHPGSMPPPGGFNRHSDSEFDSDNERRHRRRESSRHKRHRDRSDRDKTRDRDRDRDRSKRDKDKSSSSRRSRDESKSSSDRKRRSSRSGRGDDDESSEKRSRSSRKSKHSTENSDEIKKEPQTDETNNVEIKKEPEEAAETQ